MIWCVCDSDVTFLKLINVKIKVKIPDQMLFLLSWLELILPGEGQAGRELAI